MAEGSSDKGVRFKDKVAIVTGGCVGIGKGCVDVFTEHGGKVAIFDINDEVGVSLTGQADKGEIYFIHCDTSNEEEIIEAIQKTVDKFGRIDCLVNNAGYHPPAKTIDDFTADDFRRLLELNLVGYFLCCKYALPLLRKVKGNIVNVSSAAHCGQPEAVTYCASKGGVSAMARGLALDEAKNGVRVNSVSPGSTVTPLLQEWMDSLSDEECAKAKKMNGGVSAMARGLALDEAKNGVRVNSVSPGSTVTPLLQEWMDSLSDEECAKAKKMNGGVSAMARGLALDEAKNGVRVNSVSPGSTVTPLLQEWMDSLSDEECAKAKKMNIFGRFADAREIGQICLFLATDATYCTAIDIHATGCSEMGLWK